MMCTINLISVCQDRSSKYKNVIHTAHCLSLYETRCLNFSTDSTKPHYVYYTNQYSIFSLTGSECQMSWNYASSFCQNVGGVLPIIRSKSELDAFIEFVTLSKHLPVQQKIFIGFSRKVKSSKVCLLYILIKSILRMYYNTLMKTLAPYPVHECI